MCVLCRARVRRRRVSRAGLVGSRLVSWLPYHATEEEEILRLEVYLACY